MKALRPFNAQTHCFQCIDKRRPAAHATATWHCCFQRHYTPHDLITISIAPVMGCSFVPSRGVMTTGLMTPHDDMTDDCPPAQRCPFAGSDHTAFMAPTHNLDFVQEHGCSFWEKFTSLYLP